MSPFLSFRNGVIVFAFLAIAAMALALSCQRPQPSERIVKDEIAVAVTKDRHEKAIQRADSLRAVVKTAHEHTQHALATLKPLRESVSITPNGVTVNGSHDSATVIAGLSAVVVKQDSVIAASLAENHVKDLRHVSDSAVNATGEAVIASATQLGTDALKASHPRCSAKCGAILGAVGTVGLTYLLHRAGAF